MDKVHIVNDRCPNTIYSGDYCLLRGKIHVYKVVDRKYYPRKGLVKYHIRRQVSSSSHILVAHGNDKNFHNKEFLFFVDDPYGTPIIKVTNQDLFCVTDFPQFLSSYIAVD